MNSTIVNLILGLCILMYMAFSAFTIYMRMVSKEKRPDSSFIGKILWYHGEGWIIGMIVVFAMTLAILFASFIMTAIDMRVIVGG